MVSNDFQLRYVAYALANGREPEAQLIADGDRYPGGCMAGFIAWIGEQWREWQRVTGWKGIGHTAEDQVAFDRWLSTDRGQVLIKRR